MMRVDDSNLQADSAQVGWLGLRVGGHLALRLHSSNKNEPGRVVVVVIIIIIVKIIVFNVHIHAVVKFFFRGWIFNLMNKYFHSYKYPEKG